jgi:predicted metallopeptidase
MKFPNVKIQVSSVLPIEREVKRLMHGILEDYCERFNVLPMEDNVRVSICLVEYPEHTESQGLTAYDDVYKTILVQTRDPFLNNWESNPYTIERTISILCHELVHACQYLTGRTGMRIKELKATKGNEEEEYFFDPVEIEARVLESFYLTKFGHELI